MNSLSSDPRQLVLRNLGLNAAIPFGIGRVENGNERKALAKKYTCSPTYWWYINPWTRLCDIARNDERHS